ncbi:unnamed protein product, partial [Phaeothamnion confervicola]
AAAVSVTSTGSLNIGTSSLGTGSLSLTGVGITQSGALVTAGTTFFSAGANPIVLTDAGNAMSANVRLFNSGANNITFVNSVATAFGGGGTTAGGDLTVTSTGAVTQASALTVGGNFSMDAQGNAITLTNATNAVTGTVTFNNTGAPFGTTSWREAAAVTLAASSVSDLVVQAGGAITQTGALSVGWSSSFTAGANAITLTNAGNAFGTTVALSNSGANDVQLNNTGALALASSTVGGNLTLTKTGAGDITQTGPVSVGGNLSVNLTAGNVVLTQGANSAAAMSVGGNASFTAGAFAITLNNAANAVAGSVAFTNTGANAVAWQESGAVSLLASSVGGNLTVQSGGTVTQAGALTVGGNATFTTGASAITLTHVSNAVTGDAAFNNTGANAVAWNEAGAVSLGASNVGGAYTVTAGGAITQTGIQTIGGASSFTTAAFAITLTNASNAFTGAVSLGNSGANNVTATST